MSAILEPVTWDGQWCDPPDAVTVGSCLWLRRLAPLRDAPGEWARFGPYVPLTCGKQVAKINRGVYGPGFTARRSPERHQDWIYVRFDPPTPQQGEAR